MTDLADPVTGADSVNSVDSPTGADPRGVRVDRTLGPLDLADLPTPALVLDLDILEHNLANMARRCTELGVELRGLT